MIKKILNIINNRDVNVRPKIKKIKKNEMIPKSSTIMYRKLIKFLQFLHFPNKKIYEKIGILSNHLIFFSQLGQKDLLITISLPKGIR